MNPSVSLRLDIAARVADELLTEPDIADVWLEGALAEELAHARSDVDLRIIPHDDATACQRPSRLVDNVRVDLATTSDKHVAQARALLQKFDVSFDDVGTFRQVRAEMDTLSRLRTARRRHGDGWQQVLDAAAADVYRQWAVADRVELVLSLTEDLLGLLADRLHRAATLVWHQLGLAVIGLECAAAGQPLLGDKWLPVIAPQAPWPSMKPSTWRSDDDTWFPPLRHRVTTALLRCWPLPTDLEPHPCPEGVTEPGWLPQRYTDGWFVRLGDRRQPLTEREMQSWYATTTLAPTHSRLSTPPATTPSQEVR